jgi:NAD(P)-dependent dehydrogenase (short-subunit alcohol dehydrogenase family)
LTLPYKSALIVGVGDGLSASLARALRARGRRGGAGGSTDDKLAPLAAEIRRLASMPATRAGRANVDRLFAALDDAGASPDIVVYNASFRTRGPLIELAPADVERALAVTAYVRLPGRPGRGEADAAARPGRDPFTGASRA